jgi:hypothetical protein
MKNKLPPCFAFKNSGKHPRKDEIKKRFNEMRNYDTDFYECAFYGGKDGYYDWHFALRYFGDDVVEITENDFLAMTEPEKKVEPEIVTEPDFPYKGDIKDFPKEVVEWMMDCQEAQGNKRDISVFEKEKCAVESMGGFDWGQTEDAVFCHDIIIHKNFAKFFERYPNYASPENTTPEPTHLTGQIIEISERGILIKLTKEQIKEMAGRIFEVVTIK